MPKRKLTAIRLDKIAAVDKPCQQHAVAAIFKHAPKGAVPPTFAKKTFQEALAGQLISEQVSDVFWRAFENQWAVRDAFRTSLTDELAEGGDGSVATDAFTAAMQQLAVSAANAAREAASTADTDLESAVEEAVSKWLQQHQEQTMTITTKAALKAAIAKFAIATSTVADVQEIKKAAVDLEATELLPADGPLAPEVENTENAVLKRKVAVLELSPEVRKHFDALPETEQDAFLAKSETERAAEVEAIQKGDPVVYTCTDGTQIRKSDGAVAAMLAKQNDTLSKRVGELSGTVQSTVLEKRAIAEFPNVAKSVATEMLTSVEALGADTDAGKAVMKTLAQMNKGASHLFKSLGTAEDENADNSDIRKARGDFDGKVAEIRKRDNVGLADAMSKARAEFPDLHAAAFPAPADAEEQDA